MTRKYDVLLAGYYGFGNLGDELLAEACVKLLEDNGVSRDRIAVLSADPGKTRESLGTASYDRWKLGEIRRAMKDSNSCFWAEEACSRTGRASGPAFITGH